MGLFFQEKNNPRRTTSHNLQNGQFCCRTRAPPSASFGNISAKNQATKPALEPNWAPGFDAYCCRAPSPISPVRISTGIPSAEPAARRRRQKRRRDDEGSGGATTKAETVARQRRERQRDDEGSGSALTKAEPVARRGRQKRWRDDEGSGGATTKAAAARQSATAR